MLIAIAVIIMCTICYKMGVITVLAAVLLLGIKTLLAIFLMIAGVFGWRCYRERKLKQLQGGTYEHNR